MKLLRVVCHVPRLLGPGLTKMDDLVTNGGYARGETPILLGRGLLIRNFEKNLSEVYQYPVVWA